MRSKSTHQPKPRNRGSSPRPKMERQVETTILSSSNPRVKVGERCKLQLMSDGSLRLLLLEQMGMARTHGRKVTSAECEGEIHTRVFAGGDSYLFHAWNYSCIWAKGEAQ